MLKNISLYSILLFLSLPSNIYGQLTISLPTNDTRTLINLDSEVYPSEDMSWEVNDIWQQITTGKLQPIQEKINPSFENAIHWIHTKVHNPTDEEMPIIFEIAKPRTDRSDLFEIGTDTIISWAVSGDRLGHFDKRSIQNRRVIMNALLHPHATHEYIIGVDQVGAPANFPTYLWRSEDFHHNDTSISIAQGGYFGIMAFIILIFVIMGTWSKDRLYFSYALYVAATGLVIFNDLGYAYQYIFPGGSVFTNYSRSIFALLTMVSLRYFLIQYFDLNNVHKPWLRKLFLGTVVTPFVVIILWAAFRSYFNNFTFVILNIIYICASLYFIIVLWTIVKLLKTQRRKAVPFLLSFSGMALAYVFFVLIEYGVIQELNFLITPLQMGSLFEVLALTGLILYRVKEMNDRQTDLITEVARSQKDLALSIVNTQETERTNIAREIHDSIGGNLAVLKNKVDEKDKGSLDLIDSTLQSVRSISHNLHTPIFGKNDLQLRLTALANDFSTDAMDCHVIFHEWPSIASEDIKVHLYRISQELFQNAQKHSKAKKVFMQFLKTESTNLQVMYEDDGIGLTNSKDKQGLGMKNINYRVESMNGNINIENSANGLLLDMTIPYNQ